jgi:hypothetical protein
MAERVPELFFVFPLTQDGRQVDAAFGFDPTAPFLAGQDFAGGIPVANPYDAAVYFEPMRR